MSSKFDKYLQQADLSEQEQTALREAGKNVEQAQQINPPSPTMGDTAKTNQPKLDQATQDRIQGIQKSQGNNYLNQQKDALEKYPTREPQPPTNKSKEQEMEC